MIATKALEQCIRIYFQVNRSKVIGLSLHGHSHRYVILLYGEHETSVTAYVLYCEVKIEAIV